MSDTGTVPATAQTGELRELYQIGKLLAASGLFTDTKDANTAFVKMLAGREYGLGPFASMTGVRIVQGKPELAATTMAALIKRSRRYTYRIRHHDADRCEIEFLERDTDRAPWESLGVSTFTHAEAQVAGLMSNPTWQKYRKNMLFARALSNGFRWHCADLAGAPVYTAGEIEGAAPDAEPVATVAGPTEPIAEPATRSARVALPPAPPTPRPPTNGPPVVDLARLWKRWDELVAEAKEEGLPERVLDRDETTPTELIAAGMEQANRNKAVKQFRQVAAAAEAARVGVPDIDLATIPLEPFKDLMKLLDRVALDVTRGTLDPWDADAQVRAALGVGVP